MAARLGRALLGQDKSNVAGMQRKAQPERHCLVFLTGPEQDTPMSKLFHTYIYVSYLTLLQKRNPQNNFRIYRTKPTSLLTILISLDIQAETLLRKSEFQTCLVWLSQLQSQSFND